MFVPRRDVLGQVAFVGRRLFAPWHRAMEHLFAVAVAVITVTAVAVVAITVTITVAVGLVPGLAG